MAVGEPLDLAGVLLTAVLFVAIDKFVSERAASNVFCVIATLVSVVRAHAKHCP